LFTNSSNQNPLRSRESPDGLGSFNLSELGQIFREWAADSQEAVNQSPSGVTNLDKSWHADRVTRIAFIRTLPSQVTQKQRPGHAVRIALPGSVASGEISSIFPFQNILTRASFSISPVDDNSLACTTYSSMTTPFAVDRAVSFRLVGRKLSAEVALSEPLTESQPPLDQVPMHSAHGFLMDTTPFKRRSTTRMWKLGSRW
jgi:hypothetical protein